MKQIFVMMLAVAAFTACSKNEPTPEVEGQKQKLNILTSIGTRAVVAGTALPQSSAIGVHVTQGSAADGDLAAYEGQNYVANGENLQNGQNVRFDNKANASKWVSQDASDKVQNLMIGATEGTVYGYYPYTETVTGLGDAATIPATILTTGDIALASAAAASQNYTTDEVDYLYYKPDAVGRKTVKSTSSTTAPLSMAHAMTSVSFAMYVSADAPTLASADYGDENYYLLGYTIQNKSGRTLFCADNTNVTMKIADGALTIPKTGGTIARTLNASESTTGYALTRVAAASADESEKTAFVWFGNLAFPITTIAHQVVNGSDISDDIEIVFSIRKGTTGAASNYTVPLAVTTGTSDKWEAGKNYKYTIKVNAYLALGIEQVTVEKWTDVVGGDMVIQ